MITSFGSSQIEFIVYNGVKQRLRNYDGPMGDNVKELLMMKSRFRNILKKLGVNNRTGTVASANAHGLIPQPAIARVSKPIVIKDYRDYNRTIRRDGLL